MARLKETYLNEIVDAMMKKFEYKNVMQVPVSYTHLTLPTIA